jgi:hypothetical protein
VQNPLPRRRLLRQIGGVLVWGLGVSGACLSALVALLAVTQWVGAVTTVVDWGAGNDDFPWLASVGVALALPFVAFTLAIWTRVATRGRGAS